MDEVRLPSQVGMLLKVENDEMFPADVLLLKSDLPDQVAYIKTTNLDGETNLKIKLPMDFATSASYEQVRFVVFLCTFVLFCGCLPQSSHDDGCTFGATSSDVLPRLSCFRECWQPF